MSKTAQPVVDFKPTPGYVLIDPLKKSEKSDYVAVQDNVDDPHRGTVMAVGEPRVDANGNLEKSPVNVGDYVLYSIVGCEKTKFKHGQDLRKEFVISPFMRILGVFTK